jgi:hypothetical protein
MNATPASRLISPPGAAYAAYGAAVLFALHLATYFVPRIRDATLSSAALAAIILAVLASAQHLVVFPVVAALPAPRWAKVAGYTWLVVDMTTDLVQLGGAPKSVYLVLRLAINLVAALWIATASWRARGALRGIGVFVALDFACYSLVVLLSPLAFVVTLPSLVLLPVWLVLVGRRLARTPAQHRAVHAQAARSARDGAQERAAHEQGERRDVLMRRAGGY